jgi:predicted HTH domain antitoxin
VAVKTYQSNISAVWTIPKQDARLREAIPGWPDKVTTFKDILDQRDKRSKRSSALTEQAHMLRGGSPRPGVNEIVVVSLAVLHWTAEGVIAALAKAQAQGDTVRVLDTGLVIEPDAPASVVYEAVQAFADTREIEKKIERGKPGGEASAAKRSADAQAKAQAVFHLWERPSSEWSLAAISEKAGVSPNTLKLYLPKRSVAQQAYQAEQKRLQTRAARAAKKGKADE